MANPRKYETRSDQDRAYRQRNAERIRAKRKKRYQEKRDELTQKRRAEYSENIEESRRKRRESDARRREKINATQRAYYAKNPERWREYEREWKAANPDTVNARNQRRRALKAALPADLTREDIAALRIAQKGKCAWCGDKAKLTLDHIVPVSKRGPHTRANTQMLCQPCNSRKSNLDPVDFARREGRLL